MSNPQLSDYVRQQLQQGKSKDEIKNELLGAGWQEADINQALDIPESSQPPRPPATPSFTATGLRHLDPRAVWVFFFGGGLFVYPILVLGFGSGLAWLSEFGWLLWLIAVLVVFALAFVWAKLVYHFYLYELTEEGFRKEFGVIAKKYVTIPYERIQNINIQRGLLDRLLGLSSLKIFTAGSGMSGAAGAEGFLPGLSKDTAEELRNQLTHLSRQSKGQGF